MMVRTMDSDRQRRVVGGSEHPVEELRLRLADDLQPATSPSWPSPLAQRPEPRGLV
jgi:hypothetical protein